MPDINESISEFADEVTAAAGALVALIEEARTATAAIERAAAEHATQMGRAVAMATSAAGRAERAERRTDTTIDEATAARRVSGHSVPQPVSWTVAAALAVALAVGLFVGAAMGVEMERRFQLRHRSDSIVATVP